MAGPGLFGYPDLRERSPVLAVLLSGLIYALPMAGWMRVRGMAWRPFVEMSGAVVALAIVIIGMAWVGVVHGSGLRGWAMGICGPACAVMFVVMLFRLDLYTARTGHGMGHRTPGHTFRPHMNGERRQPQGSP